MQNHFFGRPFYENCDTNPLRRNRKLWILEFQLECKVPLGVQIGGHYIPQSISSHRRKARWFVLTQDPLSYFRSLFQRAFFYSVPSAKWDCRDRGDLFSINIQWKEIKIFWCRFDSECLQHSQLIYRKTLTHRKIFYKIIMELMLSWNREIFHSKLPMTFWPFS